MDIVRASSKGSKRHTKTIATIAAAAVVAIAIGATTWRSASADATPLIERSAVWTEKVRHGDLVRQVAAQGTLVPEHVRWLSAESAARVARIVVRPGAKVDADAVVLVLENPDLELAALDAERAAASAEAALVQLDVKTHSDQKLAESLVVGLRADLDDADRHAKVADQLGPAGLMTDLDHHDALNKARGIGDRLASEESRKTILESGRERELTAQRTELARLREIAAFQKKKLAALEVRAGIDGVVQDIPLENGQWVAIGTVLAKIAEPERLKAELKVAESDARDVHHGLAVRFEAPSAHLHGKVERVDPAVVAGSVKVVVTLDDPAPAGSRADQTVTGYVEIETLHDVSFVARPAGAQEGMTAGVFRLDADRARASRVTVLFGRGSAREIVVESGLAPGDEIVVSDVSNWESTSKIRIK